MSAKHFSRAVNPRYRDEQRLQDLQCDLTAIHGLAWKQIAHAAGMREKQLCDFMNGRQKTVTEKEFAKLREVADRYMRRGWLDCKEQLDNCR